MNVFCYALLQNMVWMRPSPVKMIAHILNSNTMLIANAMQHVQKCIMETFKQKCVLKSVQMGCGQMRKANYVNFAFSIVQNLKTGKLIVAAFAQKIG